MTTASKKTTLDHVREWCGIAARSCAEKGGEDIVILSVGRTLSITDAFVISSGTNPRQVRTMVEDVEEKVKAMGGPSPIRVEGLGDAR